MTFRNFFNTANNNNSLTRLIMPFSDYIPITATPSGDTITHPDTNQIIMARGLIADTDGTVDVITADGYERTGLPIFAGIPLVGGFKAVLAFTSDNLWAGI